MTKRNIYISTYQRGDSKQTRWLMPWTDLTRRTRLWNKYSETEQSWSTMFIVVMRILTAMRRRIRWKLNLRRQPNRTTTKTTKHRRTRRVISWIGILKNWWWRLSLGREGPLDEDEASSLTAWAQGHREVRRNLRDSVTGRGYYKPESSRHKKVVSKTMFEKKPPRRDRNIRTPFREKARDHSTERVTGAELRKRTRCYRCRQLGHMARECQNPPPKDILQSSAKNFFLPGDAFAQLHNSSSYMLYDGASKTVVGCNSDPKHPKFIGLMRGPARGLTDTGA